MSLLTSLAIKYSAIWITNNKTNGPNPFIHLLNKAFSFDGNPKKYRTIPGDFTMNNEHKQHINVCKTKVIINPSLGMSANN